MQNAPLSAQEDIRGRISSTEAQITDQRKIINQSRRDIMDAEATIVRLKRLGDSYREMVR